MATDFLVTEEHADNIGSFSFQACSLNRLKKEQLAKPRIFVIDAFNDEYAKKAVRVIRGNKSPAVYLRPVVLMRSGNGISDWLVRNADEIFLQSNNDKLTQNQILDAVEPINRNIQKLPEANGSSDLNVALKILRYLYVRDKEISPMMSGEVKYGFRYPEIEPFFEKNDDSIFQVLTYLEGERLLFSSFYDRVHLCNRCFSAFLNFREVCPHCRSAHLKIDDLIHHFQCAFVGAESEFSRNNTLTCPKCRKNIRQIGVDYDKPSSVYICNACGHSTQDPDVDTICYSCKKKSSPDDLVLRDIKSYSLSALGMNAAKVGIQNLFGSILEREIPLIPYPSFKTILNIEIERIKRYQKSISSLCLLEIKNLEKIYMKLGSRSKKLLAEIGAILKSVLRSSDIVSSANDSMFFIILVETNLDGAAIAVQRLCDSTKKLFEANLEQSLPVIRTEILPIEGGLRADKMLETITENVADRK